MSDHALLLVTDARWPLDAAGARLARELELAIGSPVRSLRVPNGEDLYSFVPDGDAVVVIAAPVGVPMIAPPDDWSRAVCWNVQNGCTETWNVASEARTDTISAFVAASEAREPLNLAWNAITSALTGFFGAGILVVVVGILVVRHRIRAHHARIRDGQAAGQDVQGSQTQHSTRWEQK